MVLTGEAVLNGGNPSGVNVLFLEVGAGWRQGLATDQRGGRTILPKGWFMQMIAYMVTGSLLLAKNFHPAGGANLICSTHSSSVKELSGSQSVG
jgi:hypothetical protein